jgi:acyl-CoA synthetase (NDP forming)
MPYRSSSSIHDYHVQSFCGQLERAVNDTPGGRVAAVEVTTVLGAVVEAPLNLQALLNPRSIAIVGASSNVSAHSGRTLANLVKTGYTGRILPVNPNYTDLFDHPCVPTVDDLEGPVDSVYLLVRADRVLAEVERCARRGIPIITVCTSGFAEMGEEGRAAQELLAPAARAHGSRVLGPNCIGIVSVTDNVLASPTFNIQYSQVPGGVTIVSQSGGMGVNIFNRAQGRGIGIRALISVGNEADIEVAELVSALVDDPDTTVIALLVEQIRNGERFVDAVAKAHDAGKPVVLLKVGRSAVGQRSVAGHTGAMAGEYRVFSDVIAQLGVIEVRSVDELIDSAHLLAVCPEPAGNRIAVVSPSGGECSYVADRATERGLELPELSPDIYTELAALMRFGLPGNPLDPTGQVIGDGELLSKLLGLLDQDPNFDMMTFAIATWGEFDAQRLLPVFIAAAQASAKPVMISEWSALGLTETAEEMLRESGVPTFPSSDQAVDAMGNLAKYWEFRRTRIADRVEVADIPEPAEAIGSSEFAAKSFLASHGVHVSREALAADADGAVALANDIGWPVVAKLVCTGVLHKTELGLVRVGITDEAALRIAIAQFQATAIAHALDVEGVLVSELVSGMEVIVGGVRDDTFGPVVMIGAGGTLAEYLDDVAFRRCPITVDEARQAVDSLKLGAVLASARGTSYDVDALCAIISTFSRVFAGASWLGEADLNPVLVAPTAIGGATVVDAVLLDSSIPSGAHT